MVLQQSYEKGDRQAKKSAPSPATKTASAAPKAPAPSKPTNPPIKEMPAPAKPAPANPTPLPASVQIPAVAPKAENRIITGAISIISDESGIAVEELTDDSNFTEIGIDSLSSMAIGSRFREELGLDLDSSFSLFMDCPTVKQLKEFLDGSSEQTETHEEVLEQPGPVPEPVAAPLHYTPAPAGISALTEAPAAIEKPKTSRVVAEAKSVVASGESPAPVLNEAKAVIDAAANVRVRGALQIISEESGVSLEELTDDTAFVDMGVDSLCSMAIGSRFREDLGLDLDSDFSVFINTPTVKDLKQFFGGESVSDADESSTSGNQSTEEEEVDDTSESDPETVPPKMLSDYCKPTTSVILQGIPKVAEKILFMLPDGGGSSSSYVPIPRLRADVAIIGLNCPYARDPENMNCTHTAMIQSFCNEIRRRQPKGPYHLGGWSSGGAFAYVTAETLINQGEEVHSLVIIDAPVPQVMEKLPNSFYEHCNSVGLFANQPGGSSQSGPPPYLIPHFVAVVDVMLDYKVAPLKTKRMPKVGIVWASETVLDERDAPKMKGMHFMVQKRTDFGPDGWDGVMLGAEFDIVKAEGANHFTLFVRLPFLSFRCTDLSSAFFQAIVPQHMFFVC